MLLRVQNLALEIRKHCRYLLSPSNHFCTLRRTKPSERRGERMFVSSILFLNSKFILFLAGNSLEVEKN